jgi:hypothetical protein
LVWFARGWQDEEEGSKGEEASVWRLNLAVLFLVFPLYLATNLNQLKGRVRFQDLRLLNQ